VANPEDNASEEPIGYAAPPVATRYRPAQSGNPRGRPHGRHVGLPYDAVLGQKVTIREDGQERRITAAEAFLLHMTKMGLAGNGPAARAAMEAIEAARALRPGERGSSVPTIIMRCISSEYATSGLTALHMAVKVDAYRPTARLLIEPWLVEAALARLGDRRLTLAEQAEIWRATRTPRRVNWPDWWALTPELLRSLPLGPAKLIVNPDLAL
jgi:hypothetical protein